MTADDKASEEARRGSGLVWLGQLGHDFAFSFRTLLRAPGFSLAVVITLALCIGANTAILSTLYSLVLRPPPVRDADQVVEIYNTRVNAGLTVGPVSVAQYVDYRESADLLSKVAMYQEWNVTFAKDFTPARFFSARVTADYFDVLGLAPLRGRFFTAENSTPGNDRVVVLGQSFWEEQYSADPAIVGQPIELTGETYTIIGIAPRSAECVDFRCKIFKPYEYAGPGSRVARNARLFGRMQPGVAPARALAQLEALDRRFFEQQADPATRTILERTGQKIGLGRMRDVQSQDVKPGLVSLQAGVVFVLLIGCVNVANLMLARFNSRLVEMGIRQALGASRGAIVRQLLSEALVLTGAGAAVGVALAWVGLRVINTYVAQIVISAAPVVLDARILAWTLLIALGVAFVIGLLPCLQLWGGRVGAGNVLAGMQGGTRGASGGRRLRQVSGLLVTAQFAIALVLLVGAGLLIRSFARVIALDPGIAAADRVFIGRISLPPAYRNAATLRSFQDHVVTRLREIPGAEMASISHQVLINKNFLPTQQFFLKGAAALGEESQPVANFLYVSPEFLDTFGLRLLEGRNISPADDANAPRAVMIDRSLAERYFPGRSAVGELLAVGRPAQSDSDWSVVVGVVERASWNGLEDRSHGLPFAFGSARQAGGTTALSVFVRTSTPRKDIFQVVHAKIREIDPSLPLYYAGTAREKLDEMLANRRGIVLLLGALALLALLLAAVGIYGVLAYDVSQRTREIGIRGALGATRGEIIGLIARQGMAKAGVGLGIGLIGAFFLTRFVRSLLYDVQPTDLTAYVAVSFLLLLVALLASYLPARRAAKIDPIVALRYE